MKLQKEDLVRIGFDYVRTEVDTLEILSNSTDRLEEILLRNILLEFGDYRIVNYTDYVDEDNRLHGFVTDLPYSSYEQAHRDLAEYHKKIDEANGY